MYVLYINCNRGRSKKSVIDALIEYILCPTITILKCLKVKKKWGRERGGKTIQIEIIIIIIINIAIIINFLFN